MNRVTYFIRNNIITISGLLILFCFIWLFSISTRGGQITQQFFDGIRSTTERSEVVIIGIDDKSLQEIGAWPWDRKIFAELTNKLNNFGVRVIVYDVLFLESRSGDDLFKKQLLETSSKVVMSSKIERSNYLSSFLVDTYNPNIISALSNVNPDIDGKVRKYPSSSKQDGACVFSLGEQAFRLITFKSENICEKNSSPYFRYLPSVTKFSLIDVMSNKVDKKNLKGKVVFIGSDSLDLEDHFVGMNGDKISGVEVHASVFASLLNNEGDRALSDFEIAIIIFIVMLFTLILLNYAKTLMRQVFIILTIILSVFFIAYGLFLYHLIIPLPWLLISVILTSGFSVLIRYINEMRKSDYVSSLFSKYVHKDVLNKLMRTHETANLTGEKRYLTVLFSDLRGFTTLSESLSPEDLTKVLNGYFSAMTPIIIGEHGTIDKYIGDAIMAFWNAPLSVKNHERHAVLSALRMQDALSAFNSKNNTTLAVGIGIHSGDAIVGNVGSAERLNYTILGDTVNLASRVEGLTKKYGVDILITEEVRNNVIDDSILFRKLDIITVKGKSRPTVLFEVLRKRSYSVEIIHDYDVAFEKYQKGDFKNAIYLFKKLSERGDIPSSKMCERISLLEDTPVWDGVWHWDEK